MSHEDKLKQLKIELPEAKAPVGNYVASKTLEKMLFTKINTNNKAKKIEARP